MIDDALKVLARRFVLKTPAELAKLRANLDAQNRAFRGEGDPLGQKARSRAKVEAMVKRWGY
jgi:hypothetical protein